MKYKMSWEKISYDSDVECHVEINEKKYENNGNSSTLNNK